MKIVCYKDKIIKALNSVVKGVASKTTMPILEGILIQTNDNEIKLTTYDLEIGIEYIMECEIKEQGSTVVNAIMFSEIIRKLPDTEISITLNEKNLLEIECEGEIFKATGSVPAIQGWKIVLNEKDTKEEELPLLKVGEKIKCSIITIKQYY